MIRNIIFVLVIVVYMILSCNGATTAFPVEKDFVVKPDVQETVELRQGDLKCSFRYQCSGGTSENWSMQIVEDDGQYICMIGRPNPPSYIFYKDFDISFTKGNTPFHTAELMDNEGSLLIKDNFIVDSTTKTVKPARNWSGTLALATLTVSSK